MSGWVKIQRDISDHWLWQDKPFSKGQAFIDLILMANHSDKKMLFGNEIEVVKRGSVVTSELKLMERWGWSKAKVRRFLSMIEEESMIEMKKDRKKTTINLVNYSKIQDTQTTERPQKDCEETANRPRAIHKQEGKKERMEELNNPMSSGTSAEPVCPEYPYQEIVDYLNSKTGASFRSTSRDTRKHIQARFKEGYSLEDFKRVIDKKVREWNCAPGTGKKDMRPYLRPSTLFGAKFEGYLNALEKSGENSGESKRGFNNYTGRAYDMADLERGLIQR